jgi:hypothetical protein
MCKSIVVEKYHACTFRQWTDGPKYVVDSMNVCLDGDDCVEAYYHGLTEDDIRRSLLQCSTPFAGTVYIITDIRTFYNIADTRPDIDVRLLIV